MTSWVAKSFSSNSTPVAITDEMLVEDVVILLEGKNIYGDDVFSYLKLTLQGLFDLKMKLLKKEQLMPSDYGTVLAAGNGEPSPELISEMRVTHNMLDVPTIKRDYEASQRKKKKLGSFANIQYSPED
jgi:hypothetical protein